MQCTPALRCVENNPLSLTTKAWKICSRRLSANHLNEFFIAFASSAGTSTSYYKWVSLHDEIWHVFLGKAKELSEVNK
jgi:hypothetical protein